MPRNNPLSNTPLVIGILDLALMSMTPESFRGRDNLITFGWLSFGVGLVIELSKWAFPQNTHNAQTPARSAMQTQQNPAIGAAPE
jgi:hypothetical protein